MKTLLVAVLALCISTFAVSKKSTKYFDYSSFLEANKFLNMHTNNEYVNFAEYQFENLSTYDGGWIKFKYAMIAKNDLYISEFTTNETEKKGINQLVEVYRNGRKQNLDNFEHEEAEMILLEGGNIQLYDKMNRDIIFNLVMKPAFGKFLNDSIIDEDTTTYYTLTNKDSTLKIGKTKFESNVFFSFIIDNKLPSATKVIHTAVNCKTKTYIAYQVKKIERSGANWLPLDLKVRKLKDFDYEELILDACNQEE